MKINDILKENDQEPKKLNEKDYESIINSKYFKLNFEPYINKNESVDGIMNDIRKKILFHGTNKPIDYVKINIEDRSRPRDTPEVLHRMVNDLLEDKFGVRLRNKLFTTNNRSVAKTFGPQASVTIPSDDYTLYMSDEFSDFTYEVVNGLIGVTSEFDTEFIGGFLNYVKSSSSVLSKQYNSLEGTGMKRFISAFRQLGNMIQTWIIQKREDLDTDLYNIVNYASYDLIKKKFIILIANHFEQNEKAYGQIINNIDALTNDIIEFTNKIIKKYFKKAFNTYVNSITPFEKIPDGGKSNEIIVDASYVTFLSMDIFEEIINYYVENK